MSTTRKKTSYTRELKASVLKRLEEPTKDTISSLSDELKIPRTTIYQWIKKAETDKNNTTTNNKPTNKWTSEDSSIETAALIQLAEYCRRKGIYAGEQCQSKSSIIESKQELLKDEKDKVKQKRT